MREDGEGGQANQNGREQKSISWPTFGARPVVVKEKLPPGKPVNKVESVEKKI